MNVLFLAHSFPRYASDPVGSFVLRLASALRPFGVESRVVAPGGAHIPSREALEGVEVRRFRYAPQGQETLAYTGTMRTQVMGSWVSKLWMTSFIAAQTATALRARRGFRPDLVHAHWWFPGGLTGVWLKRLWGVPLVVTMHGSDVRLAKDVPSARRLFRYVMRGASAVTTVSSWLAEDTTALVPEVAPQVAPMPVLPDVFAPGGARERDRLLFVGKLNEQKGVAHLLRALALMRHKPTVDIVAGVGSKPEDIAALVGQLGVGAQLRFHPLLEQAQLAVLYRQATALVAPWINEGLGLVAIEAQMSEMPVVAFRSGGLTDIVVNGRTGLLVPPGDASALAAALDGLLDRPDQGAAWGREGRHHALATFTPEAAARRYLDIYRTAR